MVIHPLLFGVLNGAFPPFINWTGVHLDWGSDSDPIKTTRAHHFQVDSIDIYIYIHTYPDLNTSTVSETSHTHTHTYIYISIDVLEVAVEPHLHVC